MEREEILRKAQAEGKNGDERETQVRDRSMKWTYLTMVLVAAVFAYIRGMKGQPMMDLCVTVCASVCVGQLYRYWKLKRRACLILGLITLLVAAVALVRFCMGH